LAPLLLSFPLLSGDKKNVEREISMDNEGRMVLISWSN
jgi:hypothetical protein